MPTDARSPNRNYPIPDDENLISEDFPRLISALNAIDTDVHGLLSSVAARALLVHTHAIADVSGLQAALDGKLPVGTTYTLAGLTDVNLTGAAPGQFLLRGATQWQPATIGPGTIGALAASAVSTFGGTLIDDADAAAARATLGLGSSALTSDDRVAYGDANGTIAANARVVAVNVALTAARTLTLPAANAAGAPPYIIIVDEARGITATNKLTIQRAGSDTINGGTSIELTSAGAAVILTRNGTNGWTAISTGGGGAGVLTAYRYVATSNQTSFSGADANGFTLSYVPGGLFVIVNGVTMTPNTYTASSGSAVVFSSGLTTGDVVLIYAFTPFTVADAWTKIEADARYATPAQVGLKLDATHAGTGGSSHALATTSVAGFLSAADKTKLDGISDYRLRAAISFSAMPLTGTYSRTGTLVTVTITAHGMSTGMVANIDITSGTASDGNYTVTVTGVNTFTYNDTVSGATSGNVTLNSFIRSSFNISSTTDLGVAAQRINFATPMPDVNYSFVVGTHDYRAVGPNSADPAQITVNSLDFVIRIPSNAAGIDIELLNVLVFR